MAQSVTLYNLLISCPGDVKNEVALVESAVDEFQTPGIVGVRDALLDCLTFKLGEYNADIQHGPSHRGRGIKLFRR